MKVNYPGYRLFQIIRCVDKVGDAKQDLIICEGIVIEAR